MPNIGVLESGSRFVPMMKDILDKLMPHSSLVRPADNETPFDAIFVAPTLAQKPTLLSGKVLIVPDCMSAKDVSRFNAGSIVSYGLKKKNTVTASSLIGTRLAISVQRNIPTISGEFAGEQEIIVTVPHAEHSDEVLGIVALLLSLNLPAEKISDLIFDI